MKFLKMSTITEIVRCNAWLLAGLVRSVKLSNKEALRKPLLCEDYAPVTLASATSPDEKMWRFVAIARNIDTMLVCSHT